jgi:hypothetical protein
MSMFDGVAPWQIENLRIEAPDGSTDDFCCFDSWRRWTVDYNYQTGTTYTLPDEQIMGGDGTYTLTLTDMDGTSYPQVSTTYTSTSLPMIVDITSAAPADREYVNTLTPTLNWIGVGDETTGTLYYQVQIFQYDENRSPFYISPLVAATTFTIPANDPDTGRPVLEDLHRYKWHILVYDGQTPQDSSSVSISDSVSFYVELNDSPPALAYCRAQSRARQDSASATRFIGGLVNTLPEAVTVQLKYQDAVIHTFDMTTVDNSGWFSWSPDDTNSQAGTYTFEVIDPGTGTTYSTCTTTYQPNWDLAPVEDIFSPDDQGLVPTATPTFSWMPVNGATLYRILVMDYDWKTYVYFSPLVSETTVSIPAGYLKKNSAYRVRVSAYDGVSSEERGNRADGGWNSFFVMDDAAPAHISGTIAAGSSNYDEGTIIVAAFRSHSLAAADLLGWTTLNGPGGYTLYNLPINTDIHVFALWDQDDNGIPSPGEWLGWHSPSPMQISAGTTTGVDITLAEQVAEASISGTISVDHFEPGHGNIYVAAFAGSDTHDDPLSITTLTAPGSYTISGLAAGVEYSIGVFWDVDNSGPATGPTPGDADADYADNPIMTIAGDNPGIDVALEVDGIISGTITDSTGRIAGVHVYFIDSATNMYMQGTNTDQNGEYSFSLPPGTYQVNACPQCPDPPLPYLNQTVDEVSVDALQNVTVDFQLEAGGYIEGYVSSDGNPAADIDVFFNNNSTGQWAGNTRTGADGRYRIMLSPGTYDLSFEPSCATGLSFLMMENAAEVIKDQTVTVDAVLEPGGTIQGTVTDTAGSSLAWLHVYFTDPDISGNNGVGGTNTGHDGGYCIVLPYDHTYDVNTCPECSGQDFIAQSKSAGLLTSASSPVTVDFALQPGAKICGTVTDQADSPLQGVEIDFLDPLTLEGFGQVFTDDQGRYCSPLEQPGTYEVHAYPNRSGLQYVDAPYPTPIPLSEGEQVNNIDFKLASGGTVCGRVIDQQSSAGIADLWVSFRDSSSNEGKGGIHTNGSGDYCYTLESPGDYLVNACATCSGLGYVDEDSREVVSVPPGVSTVSINPIALEYPDDDGIDDQWELQYFDSLGVLYDSGDNDGDGFTDLQEYQNQQANLTDGAGNPFDPTVVNIAKKNPGFLPAIYQLLLK